MTIFSPDFEKAKIVAAAINGFSSAGLLGETVAKALDEQRPDLDTLALACAMIQPTTPNTAWHEQMRFALQAPLNVLMVKASVEAQERLTAAADKLARRNFWVALASLGVALASLVIVVI